MLPTAMGGRITALTCLWRGDRTAEYYFPRYFAVPPEQMFLQTYYNPFETRGQRYLPYVGRRWCSPGGRRTAWAGRSAGLSLRGGERHHPRHAVPRLNGRSQAAPIASGTSGLTP